MADDITKRIAHFIEPFQVTPGSHVKLAKDFDPAFKAGVEKKKDGVGLLNDGIEVLADYQRKLAAQATHGVVVVLQALDAAGKDGTIRHVMSGVNPQGVRVESFSQRRAAGNDAHEVEGVYDVDNQLKVSLTGADRRDDDEIRGIALQILIWDVDVPSDAVDVKVSEGWITLKGDVSYQFESNAAYEDVAGLYGVVGVTNEIRVSNP